MVKSAVRVAVRLRPTVNFASENLSVHPDKKSLTVQTGKKTSGGFVNNQQESYTFKFDSVLHNASQETVYDDCAQDIVKSLVEGYNGTVLVYGQTGAGKTFTMTGGNTEYKYRGVIPRAISQVFREVQDRPEQAMTVRVSYLEIYNETLYDLLTTVAGESSEDLTVFEDPHGNTFVKGLSMHLVNSEEEALSLMFEGETNRAIAEHQMNKGSSRSHCIFTIHLESRSRVESEGRTVRSKLNLVDLAGSERVSKTHSEGVVLKEAGYINKSLTFLEQVVIALSTPSRDHIPYRQTKLTNYLKDSLGGNCKTVMVANIWAESAYIDETVSTLKFATRMMRVSNEAIINVQLDAQAQIKALEREVRELKQELAMRDQLASRSHVSYEPYTEDQRFDLGKQVKQYLNGELDDFEVVNLRQVKEIFLQFKHIVKTIQAEAGETARRAISGGSDPKGKSSENLQSSMKAAATEDGVGEIEGTQGFGVGVAAPAFASKKSTFAVASGIGGGVGGSQDLTSAPATTRGARGSARLGGATNGGSAASPPPPLVDRDSAFEEFKDGDGSEFSTAVKQNAATLKEKKQAKKDLALAVNAAKREIDTLKEALEYKRHQRSSSPVATEAAMTESTGDAGGADEVIDEEEFKFIKQLKEHKKTYKEAYEALKGVQSEIDFLEKLVDQSKQKLVMEFDVWYEQKYVASAATSGSHGAETVEEDIVEEQGDDAERFERMEMERIMQQDPEAFAFYNARKSVLKAKTVRKPSAGGAKARLGLK